MKMLTVLALLAMTTAGCAQEASTDRPAPPYHIYIGDEPSDLRQSEGESLNVFEASAVKQAANQLNDELGYHAFVFNSYRAEPDERECNAVFLRMSTSTQLRIGECSIEIDFAHGELTVEAALRQLQSALE